MDLLLELLVELLLELLVLLLLLLLYALYPVHPRGREAPRLDFHSKVLIPGFGRGRAVRTPAGLRFAPSSALLRSTG